MSAANSKRSMVLAPCFLLFFSFVIPVAMEMGGSSEEMGVLSEEMGGLSEEEKESMLAEHNDRRSGVNPPASNMKTMKWKKWLASMAQASAEGCVFADNANRGANTGENLYFHPNNSDVLDALFSWYDEAEHYTYENNTCAPEQECGHYTQVVWAKTKKVGCGRAYCANATNIPWDPPSGYFIVCNYRRAGNKIGKRPYKKGQAIDT